MQTVTNLALTNVGLRLRSPSLYLVPPSSHPCVPGSQVFALQNRPYSTQTINQVIWPRQDTDGRAGDTLHYCYNTQQY